MQYRIHTSRKIELLTTSFSAASQILSTFASDNPFIPVKLCEKEEKYRSEAREIDLQI